MGIPPVISPFDENALEAALRLRNQHGGRVIALSAGSNPSKAVLRKALSVGADELIFVDDGTGGGPALDGFVTAEILLAAIKKIGDFDLILAGRQASDTNAGVVGLYLAEMLGIPAVTLARKIAVEGETVVVERALPDGFEVVEARLPALVTVSGEFGELRSPTLQDIRDAKHKPLTAWSASALGLTARPTALELVELYPPARQRTCRFVEGKTPAEAGEKLALELQGPHGDQGGKRDDSRRKVQGEAE